MTPDLHRQDNYITSERFSHSQLPTDYIRALLKHSLGLLLLEKEIVFLQKNKSQEPLKLSAAASPEKVTGEF